MFKGTRPPSKNNGESTENEGNNTSCSSENGAVYARPEKWRCLRPP
jgi:hypothetical protein